MESLIPSEWFVGQHPALLGVIAVAATYGLLKGADWLVHGASGLAYEFGIPKVIIGATVVALGTTSPEFTVSVMAAWRGHAGLALGNAVGSVIADTGLIFGVGCLLMKLPVDRFLLSRQGWVQFGSAVLLAGFCYGAYACFGTDAALGRPVGVLFLVLLAVYMLFSVRWSRQSQIRERSHLPEAVEAEVDGLLTDVGVTTDDAPSIAWRNSLKLVMQVVLGLAIVVVTSRILVESVSELARQLGVPQVVIAATMVALGTSLPELLVGLTAIRRGHPELLIGNVIGADILNVLFVVGGSAAAASLPILDKTAKIPEIFLYIHLPTMLLVLLLFRVFIFLAERRGHFSRWMGWPLLIVYCLYVIIQYAVS